MSIIFHEGLPRSGKSYEAMTRHIFKALREGRPVDAYIEGINKDRIAQAASVPIAQVEALLQVLTREQVPEFYKHIRRNALVALDEVQNFWPNGRHKLDPLTTQAITEHGHLGQDFLLMGQDLRDVHALWRRRVAMRAVFNKLDALGLEKRYSVTIYKATAPEKFSMLGTTTHVYDPANFGTYASHVDDEIQTGNYKDSRATVWGHPGFKYGAPALVGVIVVAGWYLYGFFNPEQPQAPVMAQAPAVVHRPVPVAVSKPRPRVMEGELIEEFNAKYRPRLAVYYAYGKREHGLVEWWEGDELREQLTFKQIRHLGAVATYSQGVARIGDKWVTAWPRAAVAAAPAPSTAAPAISLPSFGGGEAVQ